MMKSSISDNYNILMFPAIFWVKYIFRVMHIGSLVVICQAVIQAKLNGDIVKTNPLLYMLSGIFVITSGTQPIIQVSSIPTCSVPKTWATRESCGSPTTTSKP